MGADWANGAYYSSPDPNFRAPQPLTQQNIAPLAGPPAPPPLITAARVAMMAAAVTAWSALDVPSPVVAQNLPPSISGAPYYPIGVVVPQAVLDAWLPPDPQPITAPKFLLAVYASNPPPLDVRTRIAARIASDHLPPDPQPITTRLLTPPISAPPYIPPGTSAPKQTFIWWHLPPPEPIVAQKFNVAVMASNPPAIGRTSATAAVSISWLPPDPQPNTTKLLSPPIPAPPYLPIGAATPNAVLTAWMPPDPAPILPIYLHPPRSQPEQPPINSGVPQAVLDAWLPFDQAPIKSFLGTPPSGQAPTFPPYGRSVPQAVLNAWLPPDPQPITAVLLDPPIGQIYQAIGTRASSQIAVVMDWWHLPPPEPIVAKQFNLSVVASKPPPRGGDVAFVAIIDSWLPSDPTFQTARLLSPPIPAPFYDSIGTAVPQSVLNWWHLPPPEPIVAGAFNLAQQASAPPIKSYAPLNETAWQWLPPAPRFQTARLLSPPISGPTHAFLFTGKSERLEILVSWLPPPYYILAVKNLSPPPTIVPVVASGRVAAIDYALGSVKSSSGCCP